MQLKITSKLLIPIFTLVVVGITISTFFSYINSKKILETAINNHIQAIAFSSAFQISSWIERNKIDIDNWSRQEIVINSLMSVNNIEGHVGIASENVQKVNDSMEQTANAAGSIEDDVSEVNYAVGEISSSSTQVKLSSEKLSSLAVQLANMVGSFKI